MWRPFWFCLECFYKGRYAGLELTDVGLGVVGFDHHVGNVEALTEVLDGSAFDAVGLAGLQYYVDDAVYFELGDQLGQQLFALFVRGHDGATDFQIAAAAGFHDVFGFGVHVVAGRLDAAAVFEADYAAVVVFDC